MHLVGRILKNWEAPVMSLTQYAVKIGLHILALKHTSFSWSITTLPFRTLIEPCCSSNWVVSRKYSKVWKKKEKKWTAWVMNKGRCIRVLHKYKHIVGLNEWYFFKIEHVPVYNVILCYAIRTTLIQCALTFCLTQVLLSSSKMKALFYKTAFRFSQSCLAILLCILVSVWEHF